MTDNYIAPDVYTSDSAKNSATPELNGVFAILLPEIRRAVAAQGYTKPMPVQEQGIPHLLKGRDLIGSAQTGTGKTAAFALPMLHKLASSNRRPERGKPRALILAPTRELAAQIGDSIRAYGKYLKLNHTTVFGGVSQSPQVKALKGGVDILVATPGRLLDLMKQGHIDLCQVEMFVLDEVDRMLDMGFIPDIKRVVAHIPSRRQTLFFSATLVQNMAKLANTMVTDPVRISIASKKPTVDNVEQRMLFVSKQNKDDLLLSLLEDSEAKKVLIFIQMKHAANKLVNKLDSSGINGVAIHGNKSQAARTKALNGFRRGRYRVLVATDVAARGLDVDNITHVINYDLPSEPETYVHRIGRTARAGANGDAISFCSSEDRAYMSQIERLLDSQIPVDMKHEFHCEEARHSKQPPAKRGGSNRDGRSGGQRSKSGRRQNPNNRNRSRRSSSSSAHRN